MPSDCTCMFSMKKVNASHNSAQVQHSVILLLLKKPAFRNIFPIYIYQNISLTKKILQTKKTFLLGLKYRNYWQWRPYQHLRQAKWLWISYRIFSLVEWWCSYDTYISQLVRFAKCCTSILEIFKSLLNFWHRVTDITSFEKHFESYSVDTVIFCPNLVKYRFEKMFRRNLKPSLLQWSSLQTKEGQILGATNFVSSYSKIDIRFRRWKYDSMIIERIIELVFYPSTTVFRSVLESCNLTTRAVGII